MFARYAADHLFTEIDELGTRDGANLVVTDDEGNEIFAPSFSMWTTIEECLNPPVIWEGRARGWFTTPPFSEPEVFDFPEGIGPVECVNVEHEEVLLMPRWVDCKRATFKYGLGDEFITILKVLHTLGLDSTEKVRVKGVQHLEDVDELVAEAVLERRPLAVDPARHEEHLLVLHVDALDRADALGEVEDLRLAERRRS